MPFLDSMLYIHTFRHTYTHKIKNKLASKKDDKLLVTLLPPQQRVTKVRGEHGPTIKTSVIRAQATGQANTEPSP